MSLRLKMRAVRVEPQRYAPLESSPGDLGIQHSEAVTLEAVYGEGDTANAQWSKWTPAAQLGMTISNPDAWGTIHPGEFYFVDITPTHKDAL